MREYDEATGKVVTRRKPFTAVEMVMVAAVGTVVLMLIVNTAQRVLG